MVLQPPASPIAHGRWLPATELSTIHPCRLHCAFPDFGVLRPCCPTRSAARSRRLTSPSGNPSPPSSRCRPAPHPSSMVVGSGFIKQPPTLTSNPTGDVVRIWRPPAVGMTGRAARGYARRLRILTVYNSHGPHQHCGIITQSHTRGITIASFL